MTAKKSADTLGLMLKDLQQRGVVPIPTPVETTAIIAPPASPPPVLSKPSVSLTTTGINGDEYIYIDVDLLDDSPSQYRLTYPNDTLDELITTLRVGQVEPIRVRRKIGGRYELITGHRRTRAARHCGIQRLKAIVVDLDDKRAAIELILSNESQEQVGDYERACGYKTLMNFGMKASGVAEALGVNKGLVSNRLRFFDLPPEVLDVLKSHPRAYSYNTVIPLLEILKESPELLRDVVDGTKRVALGEWLPNVLVSTLRAKQKRGSSVLQKNVLAVADKNSRPVLTMQSKPNGRIEIKLADKVNPETFLKCLSALLREEVLKDSSPIAIEE